MPYVAALRVARSGLGLTLFARLLLASPLPARPFCSLAHICLGPTSSNMSRQPTPNFLDDDEDPFQDIIQKTHPSSSAHAGGSQQQPRADPFDDPPNSFTSPQQPSNQNLDPFFDDDDEYGAPDASNSTLNVFGLGGGGGSYQAPQGFTSGRFGNANKSIEADLPLAQHAAAPAGRQGSTADGSGEQDYQFAPASQTRRTRSSKASWFKNVDWAEYSPRELLRRQGKVVEGVPRRITLNDELANREGNNGGRYEKNSVSTGKYNIVSFLPIFLFGQFLISLGVLYRSPNH